MPDSSTKADVEARLHGTTAAIRDRIDAIEEEITTTGSALRRYLREHPLASVGGALVVGWLVGRLIGGGRKRRLSRAHRQLVENYIEAMRDEVRTSVADGAEVGEAVQEAFHNRAPLIVYGDTDRGSGFFRQAIELSLSAAVPLFVRNLLTEFVAPPSAEAIGGVYEAPREEGAAESSAS